MYMLKIYIIWAVALNFEQLCGLSVTNLEPFCKSSADSISPSIQSNLYSSIYLETFISTMSTTSNASCVAGHWPLEMSCEVKNGQIWVDTSTNQVFTNILLNNNLQKQLKFSFIETCPRCTRLLKNSIFLPIPYDKVQFQSDGSNYYVIHMDIVLPLWYHLRTLFRNSGGNDEHPWIIPIVLGQQSGIDLHTEAFRNKSKYWISSIQNILQTELLPLTVHGPPLHHHQQQSHPTSSVNDQNQDIVCFETVTLGLPSLHRVSDRLLQEYVTKYRSFVLRHTVYDLNNNIIDKDSLDENNTANINTITNEHAANNLAAERLLCSNKIKRVGLVTRKGRRRILNEQELLVAIEEAGVLWCDSLQKCSVVPETIDYGVRNTHDSHTNHIRSYRSMNTVQQDIIASQHLSVLVGLQGSGLINGLYMPAVSAVVAIYPSRDWPLTGGDPLAVLAQRGPYLKLVNTDSSRVICNRSNSSSSDSTSDNISDNLTSDKYCDSGDMIVDLASIKQTIISALNAHSVACNKLFHL
eukprot:gene7964-16300_t